MKTLVFVQTTVFCESCVNNFPERLSARPVTLNEEEAAWRALAVEEMGGAEYCYIQLDTDGLLKTGAASHHSLLLREERDLHESLFKRRDGIDVLFATSTLAQGMNLPSEVVIISGDSRFDPGADKMKKLEAHELLNAAGRAGRAGEGAQGFVLLVPSKVIEFDDEGGKINSHWMELQAIFEQADQCLVIDDPLTDVLDQIHNGVTKTGTPAYFLGKLPVSIGTGDDPAASVLNRSFAAFRAKAAGDEAWVKSRVTAALAARTKVDLPEEGKWIEQVGGATGLSVDILQQILDLADKGQLDGTSTDVIAVLLGWLTIKPIILMDMVRPESLEGLFGEKYKELPSDEQRAAQALPVIEKLLPLWMAGVPLCQIEAAHLEKSDGLGKCEFARHFASRVVPDLAFLAGLPAQLLTARAKSSGDTSQPLRTVLATLGGTIREGCDSPEALATRINNGRTISRVAARKIYDKIQAYIPPGTPHEDFEITRQRMRGAEAVLSFMSITGI